MHDAGEMEWCLLHASNIHEICGQLGYFDGNEVYIIKDTCSESIETLLSKLSEDGPTLSTRRCLGLSQTVHKDIVPLLTSACSKCHKVVPRLVKLLSYLTSPIECLIQPAFTLTEEGTQVVFEVASLLRSVKSEFADFQVTGCVVEFLKGVTSKPDPLSTEECEAVSDALMLLRNILHIPDSEPQVQNQILWNLFAHSMDKIVIHLTNCEQRGLWAISLVQLIALIYKDQHVQSLQKLLHLWLETSMSESSEDNESNTSPMDQDQEDSSPLLTNSDSSESADGGSGKRSRSKEQGRAASPGSAQQTKCYSKAKSKNKAKAAGSTKEKQSDADSGIVSIISQPLDSDARSSTEEITSLAYMKQESYEVVECECTSTSSNEEDLQQRRPSTNLNTLKKERPGKSGSLAKPNHKLRIASMIGSVPPTISPQDKHEMKRKKLHKRSTRSRTNLKALIHHNPTEDDISHVLREFTVDFLLKGYANLVSLLHEQLCGSVSLPMDKSHFLWLITYFLKFASQLELDLEHISPVLSYDLLSYLTYEGVAMTESLAICKEDLKPHLRRIHLLVTAIREFVQTVEIYSRLPSYSHEEKAHLKELQRDMVNVDELRSLFLLLIRQFRPGVQSKQYLQDLITTNHVFLLLLDRDEYRGQFNLLEYVKEFSSPVVVQQYGNLLEDFEKNGEFVNDCIFTMMHHIAGDLQLPQALCQPLILKTFSQIWEIEFEVKDDWADLIEYVIQRFMKASNEEKRQGFKSGTSNVSDDSGWTKEDIESLYWLYSAAANTNDPIASILDAYKENGSGTGKTRESVLNQLLQQRIIGYNQFLRFLSWEGVDVTETQTQSVCDVSSSTGSSSTPAVGSTPPSKSKRGTTSTTIQAQGSSHPDADSDTPSSTSPGTADSQEALELSTLDISSAELISQMVAEGQDLRWLQKQVLEAGFVKLMLETKNLDPSSQAHENILIDGRRHAMEPVPHHYALLGRSIPIVPWTKWQEVALMSPPYILLLHKLGFYLPEDTDQIFPRIPNFWNTGVLLSVARKLGPLPPMDKLKFDPTSILEINSEGLEQPPVPNPVALLVDERREFSLPGTGAGVGVGNSFLQGHAAYGLGAQAHSVNWINLVHKSMQLCDRHSESADITSTTTESEHMDDCASLKALPPTDISEDVTMLSSAETDATDGEAEDEDDDEESIKQNNSGPLVVPSC